MKILYLILQSDVWDVIKNLNASSTTELSKSTLCNSDLPPNKILDTYTNVNKMNRIKYDLHDNNLKIQK